MQSGICNNKECPFCENKTIQSKNVENGEQFVCEACYSELTPYQGAKKPIELLVQLIKRIDSTTLKFTGIGLGVLILVFALWYGVTTLNQQKYSAKSPSPTTKDNLPINKKLDIPDDISTWTFKDTKIDSASEEQKVIVRDNILFRLDNMVKQKQSGKLTKKDVNTVLNSTFNGEINTIITIADSTGKTKQQSAIDYFANLDRSKSIYFLSSSPPIKDASGVSYITTLTVVELPQ